MFELHVKGFYFLQCKVAFTIGIVVPAVDWKPHHRSACTVCIEYTVKSKGSRAPKREHLMDSLLKYVQHNTHSYCTHNHRHFRVMNAYFSCRYISESNTIIQSKRRSPKRSLHRYICEKCHVYKLIVNKAIVASGCHELFCTASFGTWLEHHSICSRCDKHTVSPSLARPIKVLARMISN